MDIELIIGKQLNEFLCCGSYKSDTHTMAFRFESGFLNTGNGDSRMDSMEWYHWTRFWLIEVMIS